MWERNKRTIFIVLVFLLAAYPIAWAASNLYNSAYSPAEWYQQPSLFFRSLTNPPQVIPVMASAGYELPVAISGGISITIGSTTFTAAPVFSDAGGSGTLALVDGSRRIVVNIGSDTIGLLSHLASITNQITLANSTTTSNLAAVQAATASVTAKIIEAMAQQATETLSITSAQASTTTGVADLAAQQATETLNLIAALSSGTSNTNITLATDSIGLITRVSAVATEVITLAAQQATETDDILAAQATTSLRVETLRAEQATQSINILAAQATTSAEIVTFAAAQATQSIDMLAAEASITAKVEEFRAQQATEAAAIVAAIASGGTSDVTLATDSIGLITRVSAVATEVITLAAQQATEARDIIAAVASNTTVQIDAGTGFKAISVASVAVDFNAPTSVGTLPAGTKVLFITSFNGATIVGSSGIASGTIWRGAGLIASGATGRIDGITSVTPGIYMLSNEASAKTNAQLEGWGN